MRRMKSIVHADCSALIFRRCLTHITTHWADQAWGCQQVSRSLICPTVAFTWTPCMQLPSRHASAPGPAALSLFRSGSISCLPLNLEPFVTQEDSALRLALHAEEAAISSWARWRDVAGPGGSGLGYDHRLLRRLLAASPAACPHVSSTLPVK